MPTLTTLLASVLLLVPLLASATTYYAAPGSSITSCSTAQNANNGGDLGTMINNCWRNPGDILILRGGLYSNTTLNGFTTVNWPSGGTDFGAGAMTMAAYPGETPVISPPGDDEAVVLIKNGWQTGYTVQYIIIDGITFNAVNARRAVVKIDLGTRLIRFSHNTIIGGHVDTVNCLGGGQNVDYPNSGTYGLEVLSNNISGCSGYGVYYNGTQSLFDGNEIHHIVGYAFHMWYDHYAELVDGNVYRNNTIHHNNIGGSGSGSVGTANTFITSGAGNYIYNNLFYANGDGTYLDSVIELRASDGANFVYNNTIADNLNNVVCIRLGASGYTARNNLCAGNSNNTVRNDAGGNTVTTNLSIGNARFVDPTNANYRLQTTSPRSDALDAAANLSSVFTGDITGTVTRPATGPWDQGAYEMEAGGSGSLIPEKGTFFIDDTGTPNTTDCHAATGTVGSPSPSPFGTYATARVCMLAGSTLYFRTGTYPPLDSMSTPFTGGSPSDGPTTLAAYPGETVTLQGTSGAPVVFLHNATTDHFIILQGFILDGMNIANSNGFAAIGVNDIRLDAVEIRNTYYEGVFLSQTSNVELRNATKVHNSAFASVGVVGLDRTTNTTITGSEVYASGGPGISSYGGNSNLIIEKSTIRNTPSGKGIILGNAATPDSGVRIANNLIYTNTHGIHLQAGVTGAGLYYNTLWNNSTACMLIDSGVTVSEAINNVCWQVANVTNNAGPTNMVLTTNQCTGPTGCTAGDPLFASVTPGDVNFLHLCGAAGAPVAGCTGKSPAIDTGTPIPSLTSDFASKARPDGVQVDRGAFEEVPVSVPPAQVGLAPVYRTTHFLTLLP